MPTGISKATLSGRTARYVGLREYVRSQWVEFGFLSETDTTKAIREDFMGTPTAV